jgi:nucleoid DNA-binding protein
MEIPNSINKKELWKYVNRKIKRLIRNYHVYGVISILFDEMIKDFKNGKAINIFNFGTIVLRQNKPRKYFDVRHQAIMLSSKNKILKFSLAPALRKKLCAAIDIDKTFEGD